MKKIVVIGSCNTDFVISVPHIPAVGETILAHGAEVCYGGKGANQAAAAAKLGGDVAMIGCVGSDTHGATLSALLREYGVDTEGIHTTESAPTGTAYIYVSSRGENSIVVNSGANKFVSPEQVSQLEHLLACADYCITQLEIPLPTIYHTAKLCRKLGVRFILNPAPAAELDYSQLHGTWMIIPNESELNLLIPGDAGISVKAQALLEHGFENVLVTLGEQGGLLVNSDSEMPYPAYTKLPVNDTTAAGDSFIGALAFSLAGGETLPNAIEFASKAAAITVSRAGALPSLPTQHDINSLT
ncbi:MAG: ribokinase [Defluviitaleaceae bacterium]|nr:ribokinase [Defluviitaleaceae bacterium]